MKKNTLLLFVLLVIVVSAIFVTGINLVEAKNEVGIIPDNYIVVFNDGITNADAKANEMGRTHGLSVAYTYTTAIKGFAAVIPSSRLEQIRQDSAVKFISVDRTVNTQAAAKGKPGAPAPQPAESVPTGILRIGQSTNLGTNIGVAVIDTGIDLDHPDLKTNISGNYSCIKGKRTGDDDNGHGSHVAGTIAGIDNTIGVVGVAPQAKLYAVKVLNSQGSGTWSSVICGIDWVTAHASTIQVANMSLGGGGSSDNSCGTANNDALHLAICRSTAAGVTYVVAAGNENDNAANHVPAAYNDAVITVSALADSDGLAGGLGLATSYGADDTFASFSNFGSAVDLGAPGVSILSSWKDGGYNTISGTSMATPHVAGVAALYISTHSGASWSAVRDGLVLAGEAQNSGHTDPSGLHPENVVLTGSL